MYTIDHWSLVNQSMIFVMILFMLFLLLGRWWSSVCVCVQRATSCVCVCVFARAGLTNEWLCACCACVSSYLRARARERETDRQTELNPEHAIRWWMLGNSKRMEKIIENLNFGCRPFFFSFFCNLPCGDSKFSSSSSSQDMRRKKSSSDIQFGLHSQV